MVRLSRSTNDVLICQPQAASTCWTASSVPNTTRWRTRTRRRRRTVLTICAYRSPGRGIQRGLGAGPWGVAAAPALRSPGVVRADARRGTVTAPAASGLGQAWWPRLRPGSHGPVRRLGGVSGDGHGVLGHDQLLHGPEAQRLQQHVVEAAVEEALLLLQQHVRRVGDYS